MEQLDGNDIWLNTVLPGINEGLIAMGVADETERQAVLGLLSTDTKDAVIDFTGLLNGIILSAAGVPVVGVVASTGTKVLGSIGLDLAGNEGSAPRDSVLETLVSETVGGVVSVLTSLLYDAAVAGSAFTCPVLTPAIVVGGATLSYFLSNGAVALIDEGWDYVFGADYYARYNAQRDHLDLNVDSLENTFRRYWYDEVITVVDSETEAETKHSLSGVSQWTVRLWDDQLTDVSAMLSLEYLKSDNTLSVKKASSTQNGTNLTTFFQSNREATSLLLANIAGDFTLDFEGVPRSINNYINKTIDSFANAAIGGDANTIAALENLTPFHEQGVTAPVNTEGHSVQYWQDRAAFTYYFAHPDATVSTFERDIDFIDQKLGVDYEVDNGMIDANIDRTYFWGTDGADYYGVALLNTGEDHLYGRGGDDTLYGQGGADYIEGGKGLDRMYGGLGDDVFFIKGNDEDYDIFNGGWGDDTIQGSDENDTIRVSDFIDDNRVEKIDGGGGNNNILAGTDGANTLDLTETTLTNIHRIETGGMDDTIRVNTVSFASLSGIVIDGGDGEDVIEGTDSRDDIDLRGMQIENIEKVEGGGDRDRIWTSDSANGPKEYHGGGDADAIYGQDSIYDLTLFGDEGQDQLYGGSGNDTLNGGTEADTLSGGAGENWLYGGEGNDTYIVGSGIDHIIDEDNNGVIKDLAGNILSGAWQQIGDGLYQHTSTGLQATKDSSFTIQLADGNTVVLENFTDGNFGINLLDILPETTEPEIDGITVHGDLAAQKFYKDNGDLYYKYDEWGNVLTNPVADPGRDDVLYDSRGNDRLFGYGGIDYLHAWRGGNNIVDGGSGDDWVYDGNGNSLLIGGLDSDALFATGGDDVLYADEQIDPDEVFLAGETDTGTGVRGDLLSGQDGNDLLYGWAGNDALAGGSGADTIYGGAGDDTIEGDGNLYWASDASYLWAVTRSIEQVGNVTYYSRQYASVGYVLAEELSEHGDDVIYGGTGNDWIYADGGNDFVDGGADDDVIFGEAGDDTIYGGTGNDSLNGDSLSAPVADQGNDFLDGGDGDDHLSGGDKDDILLGGKGNDTLSGDSIAGETNGQDYLDGGDGDDYLEGGGKGDILYGGKGADILWGDDVGSSLAGEYHGNDYLDGGDDDDELIGTGGDDILKGGLGADKLWGDDIGTRLSGQYHGKDYLDGGDGDDYLQGDGGDDTLIGGDGADYLKGDENVSRLDGQFHGNDILDGGAGDDTLLGGGGDDTLLGGAGNDWLAGEDELTVASVSTLTGDDFLSGGDGDDTLIGGNGNDTLSGGNDNDSLFGGAGDDILMGGSGDDWLAGEDQLSSDAVSSLWGDDTLSGGAGNDNLVGGKGDDTLSGDEGNDNLFGGTGNDILYGGEGNDFLWGGTGYDYLDGGAGDDTYYISWGSGCKHIQDSGGYNRLIFQGGINLNMVSLSLGSLMISSGAAGDEFHLDGVDYNDLAATSPIDLIEFSDGQTLTIAEVIAAVGVDIAATEAADTLTGTSGRDNINALAGDDIVEGLAGNDIINLGAGNDTADAGEGADTVTAGDGDDTAHGGAGNDTVNGDAGMDILFGDAGNDILFGGTENDQLHGGADNDVLYGEAGDDILYGGDGADSLDGGLDNDTLFGGSGDDVLDGGEGRDTLIGGLGNDTYKVESLDDVLMENIDEGQDTVIAGINYTLAANIENLRLAEGSAITTGMGNELANRIEGNGQDNSLYGLEGNDTLIGNAGDDILDGGIGADILIGGSGNDQYLVDDSADSIVEAAGGGTDTVTASVSYGLAANIENLDLSGPEAVDGTGNLQANTLTGNDLDNRLDGQAGNDILLGGAGDDRLIGGTGSDQMTGGIGNDIYEVDNSGDVVVEAVGEGTDSVLSSVSYALADNIENLILTGSANTSGTGNSSDNVLTGNSGNNTLNGLSGNDELYGGAGDDRLEGDGGVDLLAGGTGDDTYIINSLEDTIIEQAGEGIDTIESSISYTLDAEVENLVLTGTENNNAVGNELNNLLIGNSGNNVLNGGLGADTLQGGGGDDTYLTNSADDLIIESENQGTDTEIRSFDTTQVLADGVEILLLNDTVIHGTGNSLDNILTGNADNNILLGLAGDDRLIGGLGGDRMEGGEGNDTYVVDNIGDVVIELENEGYDTIETNLDITLVVNVEQAVLTGTADTNATGNELDNSLIGNAGNNILDGATGSDYMAGGLGDDTYHTDTLTDAIVELGSEGTDTEIRHHDSDYLLADNVENLTLTGTVHRGNGNELDNILTGNDAANNLWGREGNDSLFGMAGDDQLIGDAGQDYLAGGDGNDLIAGGADNDTLLGDAGDDQLDGGAGSNYLRGGAGNDKYVYRSDGGVYEIDNNDGGEDWLLFTDDLSADRLAFIKSENNLIVRIDGDENRQVTINNWFLGSEYQLSAIQPAGGSGITAETINRMFPPAGAEADTITVPADSTFDQRWYGTSADEQLIGTAGNDILRGYQGADNLFGQAGDDWLLGGSGDDYLDGGTGNDMLHAGAGDDRYVFRAGYGEETIDNSGGGTDWLLLVDGLTQDKLVFSQVDDDLVITVKDSTDKITVKNWFLGSDYQIDYIQPDGAYGIPAAQIASLITQDPSAAFDTIVNGTAGDEQLVGTSGTNQINGLDGADQLFGLAGNDELNGGDGNDYLDGGAGDDIQNAGAGNDQLGGDAGNDLLVGGTGDDIYVYSAGAGADTIDNLGGGTDSLIFTGDITNDRLSYLQADDNLIICVDNDETTQVTVKDWFKGAEYQLSYIQPAGQSSIPASQINDLFAVTPPPGGVDLEVPAESTFDTVRTGTTAAEQVVGTNGRDLLKGLEGNDQLFAFGGDDWLLGGDGDDYFDGGTGNDTMLGGAGNDQLGGDAGNDILVGGAGNDTYVYRPGSGSDTIINNDGGTDWLIFTDDITGDRLSYHRVEDNLLIKIDGSDATMVTVQDWFKGPEYQVAYIQPAGGYGIPAAQIESLLSVDSSSATLSTLMAGSPTGTTLTGTSGSDQLTGTEGDDLLFGLAGNDQLLGGAGADRFVFDTALDGTANVDTIVDFTADQDEIVLHNSIFSALVEEGTLSAVNFHAGSTGMAADDNDYILYNTTTGALLYDADGNGQGVAVEFAVLSTKPPITEKDFVIASL